MGNYGVLITLIQIVQGLLTVYFYILIATAFISWVPDLAETQLGQLLHRLTDPYLQPFRRFIPPLQFGGVMLDVSFIVAVIVYFFIQRGIFTLFTLLVRLQS
jgi:YggT family protein